MRFNFWAATLALLLPLHAQETPHPNREGFLAIFPEPMPEGVNQIDLEATNQFLRPERQDSADGLTHGELQGEEWELATDLAAPAGAGIFNLRTRLTYRSAGIASRAIMNWHDILGVGQGGRNEAPTFAETYYLKRGDVLVFDLDKPRAQIQGLDLAYVVPWGTLESGGRAGGTVQLPTGHLQELQSSDGTNFLAGIAAWKTSGRFRFWAQAENIWVQLPEHSPLRAVVSRGAYWRAWVGAFYQGPGGSFLKNFSLDLSYAYNENPYRTYLVRVDKYGLQQTWVVRHAHLPRWRFGFTEKGGDFSTPEITGFVGFRP